MKIKYLLELGLLTMLLWLAAACSADQGQPLDNKGQEISTEIPVSILPKIAAGQDTQLSKLRVIIFSTRNSKPYDPKVLISNELVDVNKDYTTITYVGYNDIYVIGNEPVDLSNVQAPDELKAVRMNAGSNLSTSQFVFYKQLLNVRVKNKNEIYLEGESVSKSVLDVKLQRVIAKLTVDFDLDTEIKDGTVSTGRYLDFKSMELERIPKFSSLVPAKYLSSGGYLDNVSYTLQNTSTQKNHFTCSSGEIYLPEYLLENNKYRTILRIKGIDDQGISHTYTLPVGDAMNSVESHSVDWDITRNRHYKLKIKGITGAGEEALDVNAKVMGWSEINIPVEIPGSDFIILNKKELLVKSLRFYSYARFASSGPITVDLPQNVTIGNQMSLKVEYDDPATKTSGRIGVIRGNWSTGNDITYTATIRTGNTSIKLPLLFYKTEISAEQSAATWAHAMGYPAKANNMVAGSYNDELYREANVKTGCRAYYPAGTDPNDLTRGQGCWRLATIRENTLHKSIAWCIEELPNAQRAYIIYFGNLNQLGDEAKSKATTYYCVLDTRPPELSDFIVSDVDITDVPQDDVARTCQNMGTGWKVPTPTETNYVFQYAGTNGLPNNFFSDSYWGWDELNSRYIVATINDPDGSETTEEMRKQKHTVRCVKSRY